MSGMHQVALLAIATVVAAMITGCKPREESALPAPAVHVPPAPDLRPKWAVSPLKSGSDHPPVGRSLFDFVVSGEQAGQPVHDIPFPFEALLQRINERAGCEASSPCVRAVLIPLGRSLQRMTAAPDFFRHPRIVAAVEGEGDGAMALLKDRLFLGYQEQAGLLEVISYNEAAGRFEFQLVHDYRAGATPRVNYARREVCAACHQNLAPIFSRPLWAETNANPRIAALLAQHRSAFAGVPVHRGIDIPGAIDAATDRANLLGVWQRLWRDGCGDHDAAGRRCRGAAVLAALQYRLGGERGFDETAASWRQDFLPVFTREWRARWPTGLAIPDPDLPSRDPLPAATATPLAGRAMAHVPARFDPLQPRTPLEIWTLDATAPLATRALSIETVARRYIAGLGSFFTAEEVRALDRQLVGYAVNKDGGRHRYQARCELDRTSTSLRFLCDKTSTPDSAQLSGRLTVRSDRIVGGTVDGLVVADGPPLHAIAVTPGTALGVDGTVLKLHDRDLHARLVNGAVVDRIELRWDGPASADATISVIDDFAPLRKAIMALASDTAHASPLSTRPFNRARLGAALFAHLGMGGHATCCGDTTKMPRLQVEPAAPRAPAGGPAQPFTAFYPMCAGCHATGERSPPNFLAGSSVQVAANMRHCAPRLYARLAMWRRSPAQREKTPMPPPLAQPFAHIAAAPPQVDALERIAGDLLRTETGRSPDLDALLIGNYETLRPCLPDAG